MQSIIFATNNLNKVKEIRSVLANTLQIISLSEAGIDIDIPEPYDTFEENASEKTKTIFNLTSKNCFSEDTGLEVYSINNEPGVKSARYADGSVYNNNIEKLMARLRHNFERDAHFKTIISLRLENEEYFFEGICKGKIAPEPKGTGGFGYDPVFIPDGADKTFAEMTLEEKNLYSHRKKATEKLIKFLNDYYGKG